MYDDQDAKYKKVFGELKSVDIEKYLLIIGAKEVEEIKRLSILLQGKTWCHVNSTFEGGGVAEMLKSIVPIAKGLGVNCKWYCIEGNKNFYSITKRLHNIFQGLEQEFTIEDLLETYLETNKNNFENKQIISDVTVVHDPQPCASIVHGNYEGKMIWRCHIDTSEANEMIWNFLLPYINNYDGIIFSQRSFVRRGIKKPVYQITPAIDPLTVKNRQRTEKESYDTLSGISSQYNIDLDRPIILGVSRYDVHKNHERIINSFIKLKEDKSILNLKPILIIVGNSSTDDPEGMKMYRKIKEVANNDPDIYLLLNIENNDECVGALMKIAKIFIHISTKEGFGLVVTEALWQGTPVIGSDVGGIKLQVINGKTGYLVNPYNFNNIVIFMKYLLTNPEESERLGYNAIEHVRENFLITTLIKKYFILMRFLLGIDFPYFRI